MSQFPSELPRGLEEVRDCQADATGLIGLANIGELAGPLAHEVNNYLNALMLHLAVLEMKMPESLRADLGTIREQGNSLAALVRYLQHYRQQMEPEIQAVYVNEMFEEAAYEIIRHPPSELEGVPLRRRYANSTESRDAPGIDFVLPAKVDVPPVAMAKPDAVRLVHFLLRQAARAVAASGGGKVFASAQATGSQVMLSINDTGPSVSADVLAECFDPAATIRPGVLGLELAACRTIARRFHGTIEVASSATGGMLVTVQLPAHNSSPNTSPSA